MNAMSPEAAALRSVDAGDWQRPTRRRTLLWTALVVLLVAAEALLVTLAYHYRSARTQDAVEAVAATASDELTQGLTRDLRLLLALPGPDAPAGFWRERAVAQLVARTELLRLERRDARLGIVDAFDSRARPPVFTTLPRSQVQVETELACAATARRKGPTYSHSYFVPQPDGLGLEVMDLCIAERNQRGDITGYLVASYSLAALLDRIADTPGAARGSDLALLETDGTRLAHSRLHPGAGVFKATRVIDLPDTAMQLKVDSPDARPSLVPDLVTSLVIALSLTLFAVVGLLVRDVRRRARAEHALADALAFRKAMEDSVVTGLRARDLEGRTTYVNPAFCAMVGFGADELIERNPPPYWPAEQLPAYERRQQHRFAHGPMHPRAAFETTFVRKNGERFPAMVYEAPLLDAGGRHTGWMGAVLDLSAERRIEELGRQQQERLQATARLATAGEMASLLSHELNQPLSAIAAYATGSLNVMDAQDSAGALDPELWPMLRQAAERIAEQAERAGRVIKSVHDFVRRRERVREVVATDQLIDAILPLARLQARKSGTRIEVEVGTPAPKVICDRAMVEQVLLNLTRNGIQAMQAEAVAAPHDREPLLTIGVRRPHPDWVSIAVADGGPGIAEDTARQLFTPFFTTRADGMGLGLSVCRTIVEQHGGALDFSDRRNAAGQVIGTEFRFTLPAAGSGAARPKAAATATATAAAPPVAPDPRAATALQPAATTR